MDAAFENEMNRLVAATKDKCVYAWLLWKCTEFEAVDMLS